MTHQHTQDRRDDGMKFLVVGGVLLVVAVVAGLGLSLWQMSVVRQERARAAAEAARAEALLTFQVAQLAAIDPENATPAEVSVSDMLASADDSLDSFDGSPAAEAQIRMTLGRTHAELGDHAEAERQLVRVLELMQDPDASDDAIRTEATETLERVRASIGSGAR